MSMEELLKRLKNEYLNELPAKLNEANVQFQQKDWPALQNSFHKLKGSGKTYGVPEVSQICLILEKTCEKDPQKLSPVFNDAIQLLSEVAKEQLKGQEFPLSTDPRFAKLTALMN